MGVKSKDEGFRTRGQIAIFILFLAACSPAAAKCGGGSSGGASYDFMGDSAFDMNMDSYDEFVKDNIQKSSIGLSATKNAKSRLGLDLSDESRIDLIISQAGGDLSGQGNMTRDNRTEQVKATGLLQGSRLSLDVVTLSDVLFKFELVDQGNMLQGDYSEIDSDGRQIQGFADGRWEIRRVPLRI